MAILKLKQDDPDKELEFELNYQQSLTTAQRFAMLERECRRILQKLIDNEQKKAFEIVKRKAG